VIERNSRPGTAEVMWVARTVGYGCKVVRVRPLTGGITSSVHQLSVVDSRGTSHQVVLKRWLGGKRSESMNRVRHEAEVLLALEGSALPVPRLLGVSPEEEGLSPSLLMSKAPGQLCLDPKDSASWLKQTAEALVEIHALTLASPTAPLAAAHDLLVPGWTQRPGLWEEAGSVLSGLPPIERAFIHGDYQHFNLLWRRDTLCGIVDWTSAGLGHPDRDVGHCRLNLAVLFSPEWAERFRACYEAGAGRKLDAWWDVYEITRYSEQWPRFIPTQVAGRVAVDTDGMNGRIEELLSSALR
jgi:aminoglycoside phosphotransferase (APT) family kinase protein